MKLNKFVFLLMSILMICSTGYSRYKSISLKQGSEKIKLKKVKSKKGKLDISVVLESVTCEYQVFNKKDCKKYLNSKDILKKGFQPIHVVFVNNSLNDILISLEDFSFSCVSAQEIAKELHRNGAKRGGAFGAAAWICPILIVPSLVQGLGAKDFNNDMDRDFARKELKSQTITAGKSVSGIVFISTEGFSKDFTVKVQDLVKKQSITLFPQENNKIL